MRKIFFFVFLLVFPSFAISQAETLYVSDTLVITVRSGPSIEHRVIASLETGDTVEILERSGDWLQVAIAGDRQGWVLARYLSKQTPNFITVEKLTAQNQEQRSRIAALKNENRELKKENNAVKGTLGKVEQDYATLKRGSKEYLYLKTEHQKVLDTLEKLETENRNLTIENNVLSDVRNIKWFLTGFGVTASAWLIGFILGRLRRKQKSDITFSWK
jgi:SH3 domain protein